MLYRVTKVVSGELAARRLSRCSGSSTRWGRCSLPRSARGKTYTLTLESADVHPQLSGEHRSTDIFEPEMPVFYDVGS